MKSMNVDGFLTPDQSILSCFTQTFNLDRNQISSIPPEIGKMTSLQMLDLRECIVMDWYEMRRNLMVAMYSIEMDDLRTPDELIACSFLYTSCFHLGWNQISSIPPEISNLTSLQTLILSECNVLDWC